MKKLRRLFIMLLIPLCVLGITACQGGGGNADADNKTKADSYDDTTVETTPGYEQINAEKAKEIMDSGVEYILIDARTEEEFAQGHIEGAILIPEYEIKNRAEKEIPNKDALILVYCRSGRRSKIASAELVSLGYTNVKEFGGIIDWPYEIVK